MRKGSSLFIRATGMNKIDPTEPAAILVLFGGFFQKNRCDIERRVDTRDHVVPEEQKTATTTTITLETATTDPWNALSLCSKGTCYSREVYIQRLTKFLDFFGLLRNKGREGSSVCRPSKGVDPIYAFNSVLKFFQSKHEHIDRKEMAIGTVRKIMLRASKAVLRYGSSAATLGKDR